MANHARVAQSFVDGRPDRAGAMYSTGRELFSYALRLAHRDTAGVHWDVDPAPGQQVSATTAHHVGALRRVLGV